MQRESMSLDDIRNGLGQMEEWCRVLRDAVDSYDPATDRTLHMGDGGPIERPPSKATGCPPPEKGN